MENPVLNIIVNFSFVLLIFTWPIILYLYEEFIAKPREWAKNEARFKQFREGRIPTSKAEEEWLAARKGSNRPGIFCRLCDADFSACKCEFRKGDGV